MKTITILTLLFLFYAQPCWAELTINSETINAATDEEKSFIEISKDKSKEIIDYTIKNMKTKTGAIIVVSVLIAGTPFVIYLINNDCANCKRKDKGDKSEIEPDQGNGDDNDNDDDDNNGDQFTITEDTEYVSFIKNIADMLKKQGISYKKDTSKLKNSLQKIIKIKFADPEKLAGTIDQLTNQIDHDNNTLTETLTAEAMILSFIIDIMFQHLEQIRQQNVSDDNVVTIEQNNMASNSTNTHEITEPPNIVPNIEK